MTAILASCPDCGAVFPVPNLLEGTAQFIGSRTRCPNCGSRQARINDGLYKATRGTAELLSGPESTRATIEAFNALMQRLRDGEISNEEALKEAAEIAPKYALLLKEWLPLGLATIGLLVALLQAYLQYEGNKSSSEDSKKIWNAINELTFVMKNKQYEPYVEQTRSTEVH
jgi:hypothetical protein